MSIETDFNLLKWAWTLMLVPLAWIYNHAITTRRKSDEAAIELQNRMTRKEMENFVDRSLKPIHEKLNSIGKNVEYMRRHKDETGS